MTGTSDSDGLIPQRVPLLAWVGAALAEAQGLELAISSYVILDDPRLALSSDDPSVVADARSGIAARFDRLRSDTLGALLNAMDVASAPPEARVHFDALRVARNDLAHHIFTRSDYVRTAQTDEGLARLIELVKDWTWTFVAFKDAVFAAALKKAATLGVDTTSLYEHARALGAGEQKLATPAKHLVGLEETLTPETLDRIARQFGLREEPGAEVDQEMVNTSEGDVEN
jgi:hypothetical protein